MGIGDRVDDGHWSRQGEFEPASRMGAGDFRLETVDVTLTPQRSGDGRHFRVVAIVADSRCDPQCKIATLVVSVKALHDGLPSFLPTVDTFSPASLMSLHCQRRLVGLVIAT